MKTKLTQLREIDYTALDYETLQNELLEYIKIAQSNRGILDDFSGGDAAKIFIDLFSYLGDILAFRIDTNANELYLPTAQRRQSIINILELVGQRPRNPTAATVTLVAVPNQVSSTPIVIPPRYTIEGVGVDGNTVRFEIMNNATDYYSNVIIPAGVTNYNITAFSGSYASYTTTSPGQPLFQITLPRFPVIEGSVKVSVVPVSETLLTPSLIESNRIPEVESLVEPSNTIFYTLRYDADGRAIITFPSDRFGKIPPTGNTIRIDYRVGGGANDNVNTGAINTSGTFANLGGQLITLQISNPETFGVGGQDAESIEEIKLRVPAMVRANDNLVTVEDYEALIGNIPGVQDVFAVDAYLDTTKYNNKFGVPDNFVFVWVLPETGGEISPDLRQQIATEIEKRRLTAIDTVIKNPIYDNWVLNATVAVLPEYDQIEVRAKIQDAIIFEFGREFATFNNNVRKSKVISIIQAIEGVDYVTLNQPTSDLVANENTVLRLLESNITLNMVVS